MIDLIDLSIEELKKSQKECDDKVNYLTEQMLYKLKKTDPNFENWLKDKLPQLNYILD